MKRHNRWIIKIVSIILIISITQIFSLAADTSKSIHEEKIRNFVAEISKDILTTKKISKNGLFSIEISHVDRLTSAIKNKYKNIASIDLSKIIIDVLKDKTGSKNLNDIPDEKIEDMEKIKVSTQEVYEVTTQSSSNDCKEDTIYGPNAELKGVFTSIVTYCAHSSSWYAAAFEWKKNSAIGFDNLSICLGNGTKFETGNYFAVGVSGGGNTEYFEVEDKFNEFKKVVAKNKDIKLNVSDKKGRQCLTIKFKNKLLKNGCCISLFGSSELKEGHDFEIMISYGHRTVGDGSGVATAVINTCIDMGIGAIGTVLNINDIAVSMMSTTITDQFDKTLTGILGIDKDAFGKTHGYEISTDVPC